MSENLEHAIDKLTNAVVEISDSAAYMVEHPFAPLRDQFAMAALTGLLSSAGTMGTREGYCQGAYEFADAMMKAREATNDPAA